MGKQQRKIARRSQRPPTTLAGPKTSPETELSIIFPPGHVSVLRPDDSADWYIIDEVTDFDAGGRAYEQTRKDKG